MHTLHLFSILAGPAFAADGAGRFVLSIRPATGDLPALFEAWDAISRPSSPRYGSFLNDDELHALVGPSPSVLSALLAALPDCTATRHGDAIRCPGGPEDLAAAVSELPEALRQEVWATAADHGEPGRRRLQKRERKGSGSARQTYEKSLQPGPIVTFVEPSARGITVNALLVCADGALASSLAPCDVDGEGMCAVCASEGAVLKGIKVRSWDGDEAREAVSPLSNETCYDSWMGGVACAASIGGLGELVEVELTLDALHVDGRSFTRVFPHRFATHPIASTAEIRQLYGVPPSYTGSPLSTLGVAGFDDEDFLDDDLAQYLEAVGMLPTEVSRHGPPGDGEAGGESSMDVQLAAGVAAGVNVSFWSGADEALLFWAQTLNEEEAPPLVLTISYGDTEPELKRQWGDLYLDQCDRELAKLGVRGVTVVVADGDAGPHGSHGDTGVCDAPSFVPLYPSASPFVLTVSATRRSSAPLPVCRLPRTPGFDPPIGLAGSCSAITDGEEAATVSGGVDWTTGGGFSGRALRPAFQSAAVAGYLSRQGAAGRLPPAERFEAGGRGYPDVSALGHNVLVRRGGAWGVQGGSSAAAPVVAGLLALVNGERLEAGLPPLGPAAPLLYGLAASRGTGGAALRDVVVGNSSCADLFGEASLLLGLEGGYSPCCAHGFLAAPGWDPLSGLGSISWPDLVKASMQAADRPSSVVVGGGSLSAPDSGVASGNFV